MAAGVSRRPCAECNLGTSFAPPAVATQLVTVCGSRNRRASAVRSESAACGRLGPVPFRISVACGSHAPQPGLLQAFPQRPPSTRTSGNAKQARSWGRTRTSCFPHSQEATGSSSPRILCRFSDPNCPRPRDAEGRRREQKRVDETDHRILESASFIDVVGLELRLKNHQFLPGDWDVH